jgi:hypothetical protein
MHLIVLFLLLTLTLAIPGRGPPPTIIQARTLEARTGEPCYPIGSAYTYTGICGLPSSCDYKGYTVLPFPHHLPTAASDRSRLQATVPAGHTISAVFARSVELRYDPLLAGGRRC